jgi:hypothetical protein
MLANESRAAPREQYAGRRKIHYGVCRLRVLCHFAAFPSRVVHKAAASIDMMERRLAHASFVAAAPTKMRIQIADIVCGLHRNQICDSFVWRIQVTALINVIVRVLNHSDVYKIMWDTQSGIPS